jgi:hypothetical protein
MAAERSATPGQSPEVRVTYVTRLTIEVYKKFESEFGTPVIDRSAQDAGCDAAYKLGIQRVLKKLREDLVIE